jgi:hypothetical protein
MERVTGDGLIAEHDELNTTRIRSQPRSAPPWNPAVASAYYDAHQEVRYLERWLHERVTGLVMSFRRSATEAATFAALTKIAGLAATAAQDDAAEAALRLNRRITAIRQLPSIDDAPVWERIRASGGGSLPPRCPFCKTYQLRVALMSGQVACFFPGCTDSDGERPTGVMDYNRVNGDPVLVWSDGTVQ